MGALVAGFGLIPHLGVARANAAAVGTSVLAGVLASMLEARRSRAAADARPGLPPREPGEGARPGLLPREAGEGREGAATGRDPRTGTAPLGRVALALVLIGFALSGAAGMAFQLAWTRALAVVLGPTTYTFSLIVAATILGHALGSARFAHRSRKLTRPLATLALAEAGAALIAIGSLPLFEPSARSRSSRS